MNPPPPVTHTFFPVTRGMVTILLLVRLRADPDQETTSTSVSRGSPTGNRMLRSPGRL
jgi:hypothetical protein